MSGVSNMATPVLGSCKHIPDLGIPYVVHQNTTHTNHVHSAKLINFLHKLGLITNTRKCANSINGISQQQQALLVTCKCHNRMHAKQVTHACTLLKAMRKKPSSSHKRLQSMLSHCNVAHLNVWNLKNVPLVHKLLPLWTVAGYRVVYMRDLQLNKNLHNGQLDKRFQKDVQHDPTYRTFAFCRLGLAEIQ